MTEQEREDAVRSLRRAARWTREMRDLRTAMDLERIADDHERVLGRPVI